MESMTETNRHPSQRRYPPELKERAIRMVLERIAEAGERQGAVTRVARQLGIGPESLRHWVAQAEIDGGTRAGLTSASNRGRVDCPVEVLLGSTRGHDLGLHVQRNVRTRRGGRRRRCRRARMVPHEPPAALIQRSAAHVE